MDTKKGLWVKNNEERNILQTGFENETLIAHRRFKPGISHVFPDFLGLPSAFFVPLSFLPSSA